MELASVRRAALAELIQSDPEGALKLAAPVRVRRMIEENPPLRGSDIGALSDRELQVLKSVAAGQRNRQIAAELKLSVKTIETYREHLKYKLGLGSGRELIRYADEWMRNQS